MPLCGRRRFLRTLGLTACVLLLGLPGACQLGSRAVIEAGGWGQHDGIIGVPATTVVLRGRVVAAAGVSPSARCGADKERFREQSLAVSLAFAAE